MDGQSVSLLVRLWVEIVATFYLWQKERSASLWGCELKCFPDPPGQSEYCQPPCEAVSWNVDFFFLTLHCFCQPPCEAVSWNATASYISMHLLTSASLWGCELKYRESRPCSVKWCQPPCEAVSWNSSAVIRSTSDWQSASLWGCELKYSVTTVLGTWLSSASLWGCELKCPCHFTYPCCAMSASLWGCELKCWCSCLVSSNPLSASLWGCELKSLLGNCISRTGSQPPCEAVSWNLFQMWKRSANFVSLLVRLWVEILLLYQFPTGI